MECGKPLACDCAQCGAGLPAQARFCVECGEAAPRRSVSSPGYDAPAAYTPRHLADKILRSKSAVEGERKQVTVMFADICESMTLAESVDAEAWHGILDGFFKILSAGIHRFEGTINQYTGDGIMALFGAPIAHEDHAQRSCYAALHVSHELGRYADEVRRRYGLNLSVRIGLNSGEVIVGAIGDDLRMDYTAQGHTVGLAARVEALAAPGTVCLSGATEELVRGYFKLRDLGDFNLKGVSATVRILQLEGVGSAKTRLDVSRGRGLSRFVGRGEEMDRLDAALTLSLEGQRQVVGVSAEAGAGKSRLCYEFIERARTRGVPVYEAHCVAHGKMIPFLPILELLRSYLGVSEQDDERTAREKIAGRLLLLDESFKDELPLIFDFMGIPDPERPAPLMDPEPRRKHLFMCMEKMLSAEGAPQSGIVLFEDLHWIDGASDGFLQGFIELLAGSCELVLVNMRPGYSAEWMKQPFYTQIDLNPLDQSAVSQLLCESLGVDPSVQGLAERIAAQTGGNPFFVEEVVRALIERGTLEGRAGAYRLARPLDQVVIPASVHDMLAARIDRLGEFDKEVLQTAAVIGKTFCERLLQRVVDIEPEELEASLHRLLEAEFFGEGEVYPEIEYVFYHPLTQEVAYHTQLGERRAAVHRRVAEALESECCGKSEENAALLAHHWDGAGEKLAALKWSRRAAVWAATRDLHEAKRHWQRILEVLDGCENCSDSTELGVVAREALIEIGWKQGQPLEESKALLDAGVALARSAGDSAAAARLIAAFGMAELFAGHVEHGLERLREAESEAGISSDRQLLVSLRGRMAYMFVLTGHLEESLRTMNDALELLGDDEGDDPIRSSQASSQVSSRRWFEGIRALPLAYMGDLESAASAYARALEASRDVGDRPSEATLNGFAVTLAWFRGDVASALANARQQLQIAEALGTPTLVAGAADSMGVALMMDGRYEAALEFTETALTTARSVGTLLQSEAVFVSNRAAALFGCGKVDEARELAREAVELACQRSTAMFECRARLVLARVLLARGSSADIEEAGETLAEALAVVERTGARGYEPFLRYELGRVARMSGQATEGAGELAQAEQQFRRMGAAAHADALGVSGELASAL